MNFNRDTKPQMCGSAPGISKAAIPLEATVITISPFDLNAAAIDLQMYVFHVPP